MRAGGFLGAVASALGSIGKWIGALAQWSFRSPDDELPPPAPPPPGPPHGPIPAIDLRRDPHWQAVPVLFLTGLPERAETANAPTGVHEILAKPFDIDDLIARAERLIDVNKAGVAA